MKLILQGAEGKRVSDWGSYALVRDNVQHFIEQGQPNGRFPELHGIETAVDTGSYVADAPRLRGEVLRAMAALHSVPIERAAITARTHAVMMDSLEIPELGQTVDARAMGWDLPMPAAQASRSILLAAQVFVDAVLRLTEKAVDGDLLQIRRAGDAPAFAQAHRQAR